MSALGPTFESTLAHLVRDEVRSSPEMLADYQRRHAWKFLRIAKVVAKIVGAPLLLLTALTLMPASFFISTTAFLAYELNLTEEPMELRIDVVLASQSLVIGAVIAVSTGLYGSSLFCFRRDVAVLSYFPVFDRTMFNRTLPSWLLHLAYLVYVLMLAYVGIALRVGLNWFQLAGLGLLSGLQAWHCLSLSAIFVHQLRSTWADKVICTILAVLFMLLSVLMVLPPFLDRESLWVAIGTMLTPTGWINGAIYYGIVKEKVVGWLYLVPVALTSVYSAWLLQRGFKIHEVLFAPTGEVTPVFEYGLANEEIEKEPTAESKQGSLDCDPAIAKKLLNSDALAPTDWSRRWFIERWIGSWLSDRERIALEQFYLKPPRWTFVWLATACSVPAVSTLIFVGNEARNSGKGGAVITFATLVAAFFGEMMFHLSDGHTHKARGMPRTHPLFPIGLHETLDALTKSLLLRAVYWLPLLLAAAIADAWNVGGGVIFVAAAILFVVVQILTWYPVFARMVFLSGGAPAHFSITRYIVHIVLIVVILLNVSLPFYFDWRLSLVIVMLMIGGSRLLCDLFDRAYLRTEFDFNVPDSLMPITKNRS